MEKPSEAVVPPFWRVGRGDFHMKKSSAYMGHSLFHMETEVFHMKRALDCVFGRRLNVRGRFFHMKNPPDHMILPS